MARLPLHRWRYSTRLLFSGCDQATYQQDLVVHRTAGRDHEEEADGLRVWHIYIGPKCREDYGDLRFTDRYGRELAYYLWPDFDSSSARFAVRLEGADAAGEVTMWYGNAAAATTSDGDTTYHFFDNFEGTSLDASKWSATGSVTVSGGVCRVQCTNALGQHDGIVGKEAFGQGYTAEFRSKGDNLNGNCWAAWALDSDVNSLRVIRGGKGTAYHSVKASAPGSYLYFISLDTNYHVFSISRESTNKVIFGYDAGHSYALTDAAKIPATDLPLSCTNWISGVDTWIDYALVRAYSATPPSLLRTLRGVNPSYAGISRLTPADDAILDDEKYFVSGEGAFAIETLVRSPITIAGTAEMVAGINLMPSPAVFAGAGGIVSEPARMRTPLDVEIGVGTLYVAPAPADDAIRFAGVGNIRVLDDEKYFVSGEGAFAIETLVRSPITIAGTAEMVAGINLMPSPAVFAGVGTPYVAPAPVRFDVWQYRFESLDISRSAQDALWRCDGQINGLQAPLAYKSFTVRVPDHNGVLRTIFFGFVPGRDCVQAVAANSSTVQGFDAGFYLTRQYLPDGDLYYPAKFLWTPANLIKRWLGEEATPAGSPSRWERVAGIMPYRIHDPIPWGHSYTPKDWNFQPMTTKAQAIQEVCEYSGMVFLVKWRFVNGAMTPCAYLVHQDDIDHATQGLDLPPMVTFTHPDPHIANGVRATLQSDEKYNRIEVRSASPDGAWYHAVRETTALQRGEELPIEYLEERSDLPVGADHGGWCIARADELYAYYTAYSYTYTMTLINRTDLELYQRCRFYGFGAIPDGGIMRIVAIRYSVRPTHTEVEITVTPDSRLSDLRRLQRSQTADSVSEVQAIARGQIDQIAAVEVGTVVGIDGGEAIVELERRAGSSVRGRIV